MVGKRRLDRGRNRTGHRKIRARRGTIVFQALQSFPGWVKIDGVVKRPISALRVIPRHCGVP
ncbi:hypothetical protein JCM14469_34750 [Desulfatiferula olefinivorans]